MSARLMPAVALTLALVAACGEDPVQPASQGPNITPAKGLTEVEAVTLFLGITRLSFDGVNTVLPGVIPCPQGGQEELIEEFRDDRDGERDVIFTIMPTRCEMASGSSTFVVDGNPSLMIQMHIETARVGSGEFVDITGTIYGDLKWQLPQRSGSCPIRGTLTSWASILPDPDGKGTSYFSGSVCGHEVKIDMWEQGL